MSPAEQRALPGAHYSDGRRYSHISKAWIYEESWNDREEAAYLKVKLDGAREMLEALEQEMRHAMQYIGEVPHHVFTNPKDVVAFYERNARFMPLATAARGEGK